MSWLLSHEMGVYVPDVQCGFRLYRCDVTPYVSSRLAGGVAESETLLQIVQRGIRIDAVPISFTGNVSRSRTSALMDTIRFSVMVWRWRKH